MRSGILRYTGIVALCAGGVLGLGAPAHAQYLESDVNELFSFAGPTWTYYGWAVADIADLDGDGVRDSMISAPWSNKYGPNSGYIEVRSSATGSLIYDLECLPETRMGYSIAEAGDVDGDGVMDILGGGPRFGGQLMVWSGADGSIIHHVSGLGGGLGTAVTSAGDINNDGFTDFMGGAAGANGGAGAGYVFSG
ncbi:MAG: hypothetical protein ACYTF7_06050, partial [Planctomycetota bacterium]